MTDGDFELVTLPNGAHSLRYAAYGEVLHPVAGPSGEARALYVEQLDLPARLAGAEDEFVVWDVGMGAAANLMALLHAAQHLKARLRLLSFDESPAPLRFALGHRDALGWFGAFAGAAEAVAAGQSTVAFRTDGGLDVEWMFHAGDFPRLLAGARFPAPHAILFDPFSPARNPAMWTLPLFRALQGQLDPARPCTLATYSRATFVRAALLLAGFFVGAGTGVAGKEETTVGANHPGLLRRPLDASWLARARRSHSAEPLMEAVHRQLPLDDATWEALCAHPQFR